MWYDCPMLTLPMLREFLADSDHLSDASLQVVLDAEHAYLLERAPRAKDAPLTDMAVVDLVKLRLAYNGVSSISTPGYTASFEDARQRIVAQVQGRPLPK